MTGRVRSTYLFQIVFFSISSLLLTAISATDSSAAISFTIDTDTQQVDQTESFTVDMTVANSGPAIAESVSVVMRYPEFLNLISTSSIVAGSEADSITCGPTRLTICNPNEFLNVELPNLQPGAAVSISFAVSVASNAPLDQLIRFEPEVRIDGLQEAIASTSVLVRDTPFYSIAITDSSDPVIPGEQLVYTIDYSNVSRSPSNTTRLTALLPPGASFVSATGSAVQAGNEVSWDIGDFSAGEHGQQKITVLINAGVVEDGSVIQLTANISGEDAGFNPFAADASHSTQVTDIRGPKVSVDVRSHVDTTQSMLQTLFTVTNPTASTLSDVRLLIRAPANVSPFRIERVSTGGDSNTVTCAVSTPSTCYPGELVAIELSNIPAGGGVTVSLPPVLRTRLASGTIINLQAEVQALAAQSSRVTTKIKISSDPAFLLSVNASTNPLPVDAPMVYTVNYANAGVSTTQSTALSLRLPPDLIFKQASNNGQHSDGLVVWNLGNLRSGHGGQRTVSATMRPASLAAGDQIRAEASIRGEDAGAQSQLSLASRSTRIGLQQAPGVAFTLDPVRVANRDASLLYANLSNSSARLLSDVRVLTRFPAQLSSVPTTLINTGGSANSVVCEPVVNNRCYSGELVNFDLSNMRPGARLRTSIPVQTASNTNTSLIPFDAEVRVNGIQRANFSTTGFAVSSFSAPVPPPVRSKTVGLVRGRSHNGAYGYGYNVATQVTGQLLFRFNGRRENLALKLRGFDIDRRSEARVFLNNRYLGDLSMSRNNRYNDGDIFLLPLKDLVTSRANEIRVLHRFPADTWGVDRIALNRLSLGQKVRLRSGVVNRIERGWRYGRARHKDGVEIIFSRINRNVRFTLTGYDIDRDNEVAVFINGEPLGYLKRGPNNRPARPKTFVIRRDDQVAGNNTIMLLQLNSGERWGVKNLLLR